MKGYIPEKLPYPSTVLYVKPRAPKYSDSGSKTLYDETNFDVTKFPSVMFKNNASNTNYSGWWLSIGYVKEKNH